MFRACLAAMICLVASGVVRADEPLAWKLKEKDEFWVEIKTKVDGVTKIMGRENKENKNLAGVFRITVRKMNADGSMLLAMKMESLKMEGVAENPFVKLLASGNFDVTLDKTMKVTKIEGVDAMLKNLPNTDANVIKLLTSVTVGMVKHWISETLITLPNKAVKKGVEWTHDAEISFESVGGGIFKKTLQCMGEELVDGKPLIRLGVTGKFMYELPKEQNPLIPVKITKADVKKQSIEGTVLVDPQLGRVVQADHKYTIEMTMTMEANGQTLEAEGSNVQTVRVKLHEKNPLMK